MTLSFSGVVGFLAIAFAIGSAVAWIFAARSQVLGRAAVQDSQGDFGSIMIDAGEVDDPNTGGIFLKTDGGWIDLPATMKVQSVWNSRAAWLSAATAILQSISWFLESV